MPNIRIMNWNIQSLSANKAAIPTMANNLAKVIVQSNADIAVILEVTAVTGKTAMSAISNAANAIAGGNNYRSALVSYPTGFDRYGVLIRDLNQIRPVRVIFGPNGDANHSLRNLDVNRFSTWPAPFIGAGAMADAYPGLVAMVNRPELPLIDVYSRPPYERAAKKRKRFAGRNAGDGGFALGRGYRMPCLLLFEVLNGARTGTHLLPIIATHIAAVRSGSNFLGRAQIRQLKDTHIAQKYQNPQDPRTLLAYGRYIDLNNVARPIREIIFTGDYNVDFLDQSPPAPATRPSEDNRNAYGYLTPASTNDHSNNPANAVVPAAANRYDAAYPYPPIIAAPALPFAVAADQEPPVFSDIPNLQLKTANTIEGTILIRFQPPPPPIAANLRSACFDNIFFQGDQLSGNWQAPNPLVAPTDASLVIDIPNQIVQAGGGVAGGLDVSAIQAHYAVPDTHNATSAPNLAPGAAVAVLTNADRLIGASFLSDHLPVIVQFNLP